MSAPLVSAIVPVRNGARYLGEALASIRAQTYRPLEIVVADDGSTDESLAIARACPEARVLALPHGGVAAARNAGLAAARGALIAFLDQDDLWTPDKLDVQVAYLRAHPAAAGTIAHAMHFLEPGCRAPRWLRPGTLDTARPGWFLGTLVAWRWAFERLGAFDEQYMMGSDSDWFCRVRDAGLALPVLPEVLLRKRVHGANHSADVQVSHTELLRAVHASLVRRRAAGGPP
jgi:glycosyltransferase involved in cell wall biosynthesis